MYTLNNHILEVVETHPYLGVQLSQDLKWSHHINTITKKANSTLGFLRRNLRSCPEECRKAAYISLVRSLLEYSAVVYDPYQQNDIDRLERVQRRAARFITRDYTSRHDGSVTNMLQKLDLPPLQDRRQHLRLTFMYKITNGLVPAIPPESYLSKVSANKRSIRPTQHKDFTSQNIITRQARKHDQCYTVPQARTEIFRNSFFNKTIIEWSNL